MIDDIVEEIHEENVAHIVTDSAANHKVTSHFFATTLHPRKRFGETCHYLLYHILLNFRMPLNDNKGVLIRMFAFKSMEILQRQRMGSIVICLRGTYLIKVHCLVDSDEKSTMELI
ncbi:hypothetical protein CR513_31452, partial [Mucuna pruriens]